MARSFLLSLPPLHAINPPLCSLDSAWTRPDQSPHLPPPQWVEPDVSPQRCLTIPPGGGGIVSGWPEGEGVQPKVRIFFGLLNNNQGRAGPSISTSEATL